MYSQAPSVTESQHASSRLSVADILSSMANGGESTAVTTFANVDGLTSGIPTRTTPTLTPTTMKNIEDSFLEMQSIPPAPLEHQHQAGFVPPVVNISGSSLVGQNGNSYSSQLETKEENENWLPSCVQATYGSLRQPPNTTSAMTTKPSGRNHGGRKPNRDEKLSPEEEERRRVRRERNKQAAARCRKRRMDHTNSLMIETEDLEEKRLALQNEIHMLTTQKEELEFLLEAHKATCKMTHRRLDGKRPINGSALATEKCILTTMANGTEKFSSQMKPLSRPTSLPVSSAFTNPDGSSALKVNSAFSDATGIPITTPSNGIFNYESLMEGGTGLTPVSSGLVSLNSSCGIQQRSSSSDISSPDSMNPPPKLVSL